MKIARVTFQLTRLQCNETEDFGPPEDEVYLQCETSQGNKRLGVVKMKRHDRWENAGVIIDKQLISEGQKAFAKVSLWDEDRGQDSPIDSDDKLGEKSIEVDVNSVSKEDSWDYTGDDANYNLFWKLEVESFNLP